MLSPNLSFRFILIVVLIVLLPLNWIAAQGRQSGEIRGTVTDPSESVLPGVTVTLTNALTGVRQVVSTDSSGVYDISYVPPGEYSITFSKAGFGIFTRDGLSVHVGTITIDATLKVGAVTETVSVTGQGSLVETETVEKNTTLTSQVVGEAPSITRTWTDFLATLPGVNPGGGTTGGASDSSTGQGIGVNGQQSFSSSWQIDGGIAMLGQSSNPDMLAPPLDDIEEVSLNTANFGAENGSGLSVFNVITKSGTNQFHGTVYEFIENDVANAQNKFAQSQTPLRWNEYGLTLGGPIKRNKAFFFFGFQQNPSDTFNPAFATFPTNAYRNGDFSALLGQPVTDGNGNPVLNPCTGQQILQGQIYDPATTQTVGGQTCRMPFQGNVIPPGRLDSVALNVQQYFPGSQTDALFNNYYTNLRNPVSNRWINAKVDYNITPTNRITGSTLLAHTSYTIPDPNCAINCSQFRATEPQGQITDSWAIGQNLVSEFRFSLSREHATATVVSQGKGYPAQLKLKNAAGDLFPTISIGGVLSTSIGPANANGGPGFPPAIDAETTFIPSEIVTWVKGKHIFKFGGEYDRWWVNTGWGTQSEGAFDFSGLFTQNPIDQTLANVPTEGEGYADFLLGLPDQWQVVVNPETGGRMWNTQLFAQDEYKLRPDLTLTLGLRYVIQSGWSEVNNELSSFDPHVINPSTGTPGALWYAGQQGRRALTNTIYDFFAPRLGFAWSPKKDLSIRGGYGIYNIIASSNVTAPGNVWGQGWAPSGFLQTTDQLTPVFQLSQGPPPPVYPTTQNRTPDLLNGQGINYSIPDSPLSYAEEYQLDLQHQIKGGVLLDVGYVGNRGVHLSFARDINQVPARLLGQGQSARPYQQFANIDAAFFDGVSNYNALQITVKKQVSEGLTFAANYAWAKTMDEITSAGWGGSGSNDAGGYQNANDPRANYGPATNDIRHLFNGNVVYHLPFGSGKSLLNRGGIVNALAGGWELSSIFSVRTGLPFTALVDGPNLSGALSGNWRPNQIRNAALSNPTINQWFDTSAFAQPPVNSFGNARRDTLYGPHFADVDLGLTRNFALKILGEQGKLQIRLTAANAFNHPNFNRPHSSLGNSNFGIIDSAENPRRMQLGARISF